MKRNWQKLWSRNYHPYLGATYLNAFNKQGWEFAMCKNKLFLPEGGLHAIYFDTDEFQTLLKSYTEYIHTQDIPAFAQQYEQKFIDLLIWAKTFGSEDFSSKSSEALSAMADKHARAWMKSGSDQFISFLILEGPGKELEKMLDSYPNKAEVLGWITTPYKHTHITRARMELLEMIRDGKTSEEHLRLYVRVYAWLPMYQFPDEPLTLAALREQIAQITNPVQELLEIETVHRARLAKYREFFDSLPEDHFKKTVEIVHHFTYLKEMRDDYRRPAYHALLPFWEEVARRLKMTIAEANYLLPHELIHALRFIDRKWKQQVKERKPVWSLVLADGETSIETSDVRREYMTDERGGSGELTGNIAFHGIAVGRVCIVNNRRDFLSFKDGDVLVTAMTHPEFLPIMKRASAIVTDEGGVTCHAAIVARELKVPCIIGTGDATATFETGDNIVVDAERGIVRRAA